MALLAAALLVAGTLAWQLDLWRWRISDEGLARDWRSLGRLMLFPPRLAGRWLHRRAETRQAVRALSDPEHRAAIEGALERIGALTRAYHDAMASFPSGVEADGSLVLHGDLAGHDVEVSLTHSKGMAAAVAVLR